MPQRKIIEVDPDAIDWGHILNTEVQKELEIFLKNKKAMQIENYDEYDDNGNPIEDKQNWKNIAVNIAKIPLQKFTNIKNTPFYRVNEFVYMNDGSEGHLNSSDELEYFAYRYHKINKFHPNIYRFEQFNITTFIKNLFKHCNVPEESYVKVSHQSRNEARITSLLIAFKEDLLLYVDGKDKGAIYYNPKDENNKDSFFYILLGLLKSVKRPKLTKNKIYVVHRNTNAFEKTGFSVNKIKMNLEENYNDNFPEIAQKIVDGLNSKKETHLVILSGETGTGKCVVGNTKITIRNKKTKKIEEINIADLM